MVKKILLVVLAAVVVFAVYVATRPSSWKVERSIVVKAPAGVVYDRVADFHRWPAWSPWAHLDPNMATDFSGPDSGTGAIYHWKGNDKVGEGRMTITGANPPKEIVIKLEFVKPWEQVSTTTFTFKPEGMRTTRVTWSMTGENDFVGKLFAVFMNMDKVIGTDFQKGLGSLKLASEERD
jgi:hypothetical protein